MNGPAYYNEFDPAAADWLEWLIGQGLIAAGVVDRRSIELVQPDDLAGFRQVHLFAGIGGWSLAARLAGFRDDEPLWTASCPCQPFSVAGKGAGRDDPRHLWPHVLRLTRARRPARLVGEQVAGAAGYDWFDGVAADLEGEGYACRAVDIPACAVDAPHIRQRQYWAAVVDAARVGRGEGGAEPEVRRRRAAAAVADAPGNLGDALRPGLEGHAWDGDAGGRPHPSGSAAPADGRLVGDPDGSRQLVCEGGQGLLGEGGGRALHTDSRDVADADDAGLDRTQGPAPEPGGDRTHRGLHLGDTGRNGTFWSDAEWITCHDGKARRTPPGLPLLVDGFPGRVAAWRGFGNAIVPPLAAQVLAALKETADA